MGDEDGAVLGVFGEADLDIVSGVISRCFLFLF